MMGMNLELKWDKGLKMNTKDIELVLGIIVLNWQVPDKIYLLIALVTDSHKK